MKLKLGMLVFLFTIGIFCCGAVSHTAAAPEGSSIKQNVDSIIASLMKEYNIPGMAVGISSHGKRHIFTYGLASKTNQQRVTEDTLFEIGSISKTFTATLAAYAQTRGHLLLTDAASKYLPVLKGSFFDTISLLNLGTYTAGGLPLQFPDRVSNEKQMFAYFKNWKPEYAAGSRRLYSNPSLGLFGYLVAQSMGENFDDLMEKTLFPLLGLNNTYIRVPQNRMADYAFGYTKDDRPIRVSPGVLDSEAYGIKTTVGDLLYFIEANMHAERLDKELQSAIAITQSGYYTVDGMTQGLGWEMYTYPADLGVLIAGNSTEMILQARNVAVLAPPTAPQPDMLFNKTGSTNGFGTYAAFVPGRDTGVVLLANKGYPNPARVEAAYRILKILDGMQ